VHGVPHAQAAEALQRALARTDAAQQLAQRQRSLDGEAQLPGVAPFLLADRFFDGA
jgi:hypothetical protein